jgi:uncharacterized protein (TIGR04255 family)
MPPTPRDSTMPSLPEADTRLLARPPLEVVLCEIRAISDTPVTLGSAEGLRLKDVATAAGFAVERIEQTQQQAIRMDVVPGEQAAHAVETRSIGWQLVSADGGSVAHIQPGSVSIQTTKYMSWKETFRPMLAGAIAAFADVVKPQIRQRVGLRYIDRLVDPGASNAVAWRGRVADSLLGPIADPTLGERIVSSQQQVEVEISENRRALLRHGPFGDGALHGAISYMLDTDVFDTSTTEFDVEGTLAVTDELNQLALSLFQVALTQHYLAELRGEV